jgi:nicotinamidase-related amidase
MIQTNSKTGGLIDASDAVLLLIDHQSGLLQLVKDIDVPTLRANVAALARIATLAGIPVVTTSSVATGPNGPPIPELQSAAPGAAQVARMGEINAWHAPAFKAAVEATGKRTLLIAGVLTSVCVALPSLSAVAEGYRVFGIIDASGTVSIASRDVTVLRLVQAGVTPIDTMAVLSELQGTWALPDAAAYGEVYASLLPSYQLVQESFMAPHTK